MRLFKKKKHSWLAVILYKWFYMFVVYNIAEG